MLDRIFALFALACLLAFFGIVIRFVPHPDLVVVILIGLALAVYDMATQLFVKRRVR